MIDERYREYEIALHQQLLSIQIETRKARRKDTTGHRDLVEFEGLRNAENPYSDMLYRRLFDVDPGFDVDPDNKDEVSGYGHFITQINSLLPKQQASFLWKLKRL